VAVLGSVAAQKVVRRPGVVDDEDARHGKVVRANRESVAVVGRAKEKSTLFIDSRFTSFPCRAKVVSAMSAIVA